EVGACSMVASTIVPVVIRTPCACKCRFTCPKICSPSWCASSKCRNLHTVVSSGTGSQPKSMPTNCRITPESYSASSTAGSDRLNHCCKSAACALLPPGAARSQAWDNAAPPARTTRATAPPAPSPPEISLAASSLCTAQSRSSSLESSVSFLRHLRLLHGTGIQAKVEVPHCQPGG